LHQPTSLSFLTFSQYSW